MQQHQQKHPHRAGFMKRQQDGQQPADGVPAATAEGARGEGEGGEGGGGGGGGGGAPPSPINDNALYDEEGEEEEFDHVEFGFDDDDDEDGTGDGDGDGGDFIDTSQLNLNDFTAEELDQLRDMIEASGGDADKQLGPLRRSGSGDGGSSGGSGVRAELDTALPSTTTTAGSAGSRNSNSSSRRRRNMASDTDELCWLCGRHGHAAADCDVPPDGTYRRDPTETRPLHLPVMAAEVHAALQVRPRGVYLDGTFGAGGHTRAILEVAGTTVVAVDCDPVAITVAEDFAAQTDGRVVVAPGRLGSIAETLDGAGVALGSLDGVLMDVGVSSMQLGGQCPNPRSNRESARGH